MSEAEYLETSSPAADGKEPATSPAPGEAFMIGDSNVDIATGKNAGIKTIGCAWGFRGADELKAAGADFIAYSPADILSAVKSPQPLDGSDGKITTAPEAKDPPETDPK